MKRRLDSVWLLGAVLALFTVLLRWPGLDLPLDRDEGTYATMAMAWSKHWGFPYLDFLDHKPPLLYGLYALAFQWGGWTAAALRGFSLLWQTAAALCFAVLLRRWPLSTLQVWLGAWVWVALGSAWRTQAIAANAEGWGLLPVLAGLLWLQPQSLQPSAGRWIGWGVAAGLAACIKQPFYVFALGLPLLFETGPRRWSGLLYSLLGLLFSQLPWIFWLSWHGALGAAWQAVFAFHAGYGSPLSWEAWAPLGGLLYHLRFEEGGLWLLALLAYAARNDDAAQGTLRRLGLSCLALGFFASALSGRWYPHYAVLWVPGLALGAALAAGPAAGSWQRRGALALAVLACLGFAWAQRPFWAESDGPSRSRHLFGLETFAQAPAVAAAIQSHSGPDDRLLIWGADAEIYFLAQRRPATRFLSHYSFTGETPAWPGAEAELWQALGDPRTQVLVLSDRLDFKQDLQRRLGLELQKTFDIRHDPASAFWLGLRRR